MRASSPGRPRGAPRCRSRRDPAARRSSAPPLFGAVHHARRRQERTRRPHDALDADLARLRARRSGATSPMRPRMFVVPESARRSLGGVLARDGIARALRRLPPDARDRARSTTAGRAAALGALGARLREGSASRSSSPAPRGIARSPKRSRRRAGGLSLAGRTSLAEYGALAEGATRRRRVR